MNAYARLLTIIYTFFQNGHHLDIVLPLLKLDLDAPTFTFPMSSVVVQCNSDEIKLWRP